MLQNDSVVKDFSPITPLLRGGFVNITKYPLLFSLL